MATHEELKAAATEALAKLAESVGLALYRVRTYTIQEHVIGILTFEIERDAKAAMAAMTKVNDYLTAKHGVEVKTEDVPQ